MFVQTRASLLKNITNETCETIVFKTKKIENKTSISNSNSSKNIPIPVKEPNKKDQLDMKKLRYEVIKFGSSGFDGTKKEESRVALAVALGARPLKRKCKNYVEILAERKAAKEKGNKVNIQSNFKTKKRKEKKIGGLLKTYGKVRPDK